MENYHLILTHAELLDVVRWAEKEQRTGSNIEIVQRATRIKGKANGAFVGSVTAYHPDATPGSPG